MNSGAELPEVAAMDGWFVQGGQALRVLEVEEGLGEVIFVLDPALQPLVLQLAEHYENQLVPTQQLDPGRQLAMRQAQLAKSLAFDIEVRAQFLTPLAPRSETRLEGGQVFPYSPTYSMSDRSLLQVLNEVRPTTFPLRFADAVAEAGRWLRKSPHRRAVVVLLGDRAVDSSHLTIAEARAQLEQWQVPLLVWTSANPDDLIPSWGSVERLLDPFRPERVFALFENRHNELQARLERQRVIWLDTAEAEGIELTEKAAGRVGRGPR